MMVGKECTGPRARKLRAATLNMENKLKFVDTLELGEKARMEMENKKLELARMHFGEDQKKITHEERKEKREAADVLELKKIELMTEMKLARLKARLMGDEGSGAPVGGASAPPP